MTVILPATLESRDGFSKERRPDFSYKLNPGQYGLDMTFPDKMDIDESRMAVWVPFADGHRRDGVGDLLEVGGINTERHRANPVILFDHGKKVELPVGMAEDPDTKEYKVVIDSVSKIAKAQAFFYQGKGLTSVDRGQEYDHAVFCEQLFDMIAKRIIRGGSIGYQVVRAVDLSPDYQTGIPKGMHLIQTLMLEASVVVMPANMDTVRKALDMPQICGKSLSPTLRKCLEPYAPERKAQFGWEKKSHPIDQQQKPVEDKEPDKRDWTTDETVEFKKKSAKDVRERLRAYRERDERGANRTTPTIRVSSPVLTTEIKQMSEDGDKLYPVDDGPEIGMSHIEMGSIIAAVVGMVLAGWGITKAVQWAIQKHKGPITPQDESKIEEAARAEVARKSNGTKGYGRAMGQGALRGAAIGLAATAPVGMIQGAMSGYDMAHAINDDVQEAAESSDVTRDYQINRHMLAGTGAGIVGLGFGAVGAGVGAVIGAGHGLVAEYLREKAEQRQSRGQKGYARAIGRGALRGAIIGGGVGLAGGGVVGGINAGQGAYATAQGRNEQIDEINARTRSNNEVSKKRNARAAEIGDTSPMWDEDIPEHPKVSVSEEVVKASPRGALRGALLAGGIGATLGAAHGAVSGAYQQYRQNKKDKKSMRPPMAGFNWQQEEGQRLGSVLIPAAIASVIGIVAAGAGLAYAVTHVVRKMRQQGEQVTPEMEQVIADEAQSKLAAMGKSQGVFLQKAYHSIRYGCKDLEGTDTAVLEATDELLASTDGDVDEALLILHNTVEGIESGELEGDQSVLDFAGEVALALDEVDAGDVGTKGYGRAMIGGAIAGGLAGAGYGAYKLGTEEYRRGKDEYDEAERDVQIHNHTMIDLNHRRRNEYDSEEFRKLGLSSAEAPMLPTQRGTSESDEKLPFRRGVGGGVAGAMIGGTLGAITGAGAGAIRQYRQNRKQSKQD